MIYHIAYYTSGICFTIDESLFLLRVNCPYGGLLVPKGGLLVLGCWLLVLGRVTQSWVRYSILGQFALSGAGLLVLGTCVIFYSFIGAGYSSLEGVTYTSGRVTHHWNGLHILRDELRSLETEYSSLERITRVWGQVTRPCELLSIGGVVTE